MMTSNGQVMTPGRSSAEDAEALPGAVGGAPPQDDGNLVEFLMFRVGSERYAAELARIAEVVDRPQIHFVPEMPPAMLGVISVRGAFVRVYSPGAVLHVRLSDRRAVLIVRQGERQLGILVDDVEDALAVDLRTLRPPHGGGAGETIVAGMLQHGQSLVSVVDADALVAACRTVLLAEVS